jgi:uncharacterized protein YegJ (DUF2314 family)
MKYQLLLFIPLLTVGCATQPRNHTLAREMIRPGVEPERFHIKADDAEMANSVQRARRTVRTFIAAVQHPTATQRDFEVKKPFAHEGVLEHLWLSEVTFSGGRFHGKVDNHPRNIPGVKMGDRVSVNPNEITDWAFVDKGILVGGYTIRVLFNELSPERKQALQTEANFRITKS